MLVLQRTLLCMMPPMASVQALLGIPPSILHRHLTLAKLKALSAPLSACHVQHGSRPALHARQPEQQAFWAALPTMQQSTCSATAMGLTTDILADSCSAFTQRTISSMLRPTEAG